ncbi:hypothetical protein Acsp02_97450 [Actinoplanes sp. NBRC 103695]|nr:hypothetical protein Acsp02_97450 [Actinoplanes sp. NBRC 103695]
MRDAATVLEIIRERGKRGLPLERVYRCLFNPDLYLLAYGKIYRNAGAMTPGVTRETVDGMRLGKIEAMIGALRQERYRWTPVRRTYIEKKGSSKKRPLGLPTWSDKLLQEVLRLIWRRITSRGSPTVPTGSVRAGDVIPPCWRSITNGGERCGSLRVTSPTVSDH